MEQGLRGPPGKPAEEATGEPERARHRVSATLPATDQGIPGRALRPTGGETAREPTPGVGGRTQAPGPRVRGAGSGPGGGTGSAGAVTARGTQTFSGAVVAHPVSATRSSLFKNGDVQEPRRPGAGASGWTPAKTAAPQRGAWEGPRSCAQPLHRDPRGRPEEPQDSLSTWSVLDTQTWA